MPRTRPNQLSTTTPTTAPTAAPRTLLVPAFQAADRSSVR
ncbi:Uncharacterised protein [Mycobacteroides abscessus]|nr:Uncharacterised protein [Mycobacteroides abscessus]